ncbi:hypothetical protein SISNIDRAFT_97404 [Sistotremastrum niveocremeum HHB9708]|uniref:Uncharacterized protein n=1 Tax=Sistotremastrum niveocremeum HHB9708 TaxID=1314777 RepID=A0A164U964_9AGAM|nr:hypothetical protein SISNIDRAFT_97404 [Sistotremastrum niveocremeum HHB9708]
MDAYPSYSRPETVRPFVPIDIRPLHPIQPGPARATPLPQLPFPPRQPRFSDAYELSTHIVPAAFPRRATKPFEPIADEETREQRTARIKRVAEDLEKRDVDMDDGQRGRKVDDATLWNVWNRYRRKEKEGTKSSPGDRDGDRKGGGGLTLIVLHANGFPKEIWEPTLGHFISAASKSVAAPVIAEIWCMESVNHGESALLNQPHLGDMFDWADNVRDLLNFLLNYLPPVISQLTLPTHLARKSESLSGQIIERGFQNRVILLNIQNYSTRLSSSTLSLHPLNSPANVPVSLHGVPCRVVLNGPHAKR